MVTKPWPADRERPPRNTTRHINVLVSWHYTALLMKAQGFTNPAIAEAMHRSLQAIKDLNASPQAKRVVEAIKSKTISTMSEVAAKAQIVAPEMLDLLINEARTAMESSSRIRAQKAVLEIAGHTPVHHMVVERPDEIEEEFKGLTDEEIKAKVLGKKPADKGPDGKMLS